MRVLLILLLALSLYADHDGRKEHHLSKDLSYLELSDVQQERVKNIIKIYRHDLKLYRDFKEEREKQRESLFVEDLLNTQALLQLHEAIEEKSAEIENRFFTQMHAILTPEQRLKFAHNFDEWEVE